MGSKTIAAGRDVRTLFDVGTVGGLSDAELLERFVSRQEGRAEPAFSALLERHGPMVWGVCRRVLDNPHDASDAFQATFLVLVRRAAVIRVEDSLGSWLYGVSRRVALRAKRVRTRRSAREVQTTEASTLPSTSATPPDDPERAELLAVLDEEIGRLPERYRTALVLCDLNGLKHEAAARQLGCAVGTIGSRLARGREQLRSRLARRGLASSAGIVTTALSAEASAAHASLPAPLARLTIQAAIDVATSPVPFAEVVSASVATLTEGTLRAMVATQLKLGAIALLTATLIAGGTAVHALQSPGAGKADVGAEGLSTTPVQQTREEPSPNTEKTPQAVPTEKTPQAVPNDSEPLRDELDLLAVQLDTKKGELARAKAQSNLALAIVATNVRLNTRKPGMVSKEELAKGESEVAAARAMIEIADAEVREVELRIEQLRRIQRSPDRLKDYLGRSRDSDYHRLERRLDRLEQKLNQILNAQLLRQDSGPTDLSPAPIVDKP